MIKKTIVSFVKREFPAGSVLVPTIAQIPSAIPEIVTFEMQIEAKEKRYVLPMPDGTPDELDEGKYLAVHESFGTWHGSESRYDITKTAELEYFSVTQADIDAAPGWVKAITPVEVTDDGEN
ncbi:hypothetical protein [Lacticaseibacillus suibinensis]|uniref:hypothetical protein n=1 Tax=Lacticaseibacillus suibinensis TaxID=2486011 RepID=UPI0019427B96|nr:hypothetical protein [Lacticaseibacillus suibinensis]